MTFQNRNPAIPLPTLSAVHPCPTAPYRRYLGLVCLTLTHTPVTQVSHGDSPAVLCLELHPVAVGADYRALNGAAAGAGLTV